MTFELVFLPPFYWCASLLTFLFINRTNGLVRQRWF